MSIHSNSSSLVREALTEMVSMATRCVAERKTDGGCYGFPASVLLFSIIDAIGSYHRNRAGFSVMIDGRSMRIDGDGGKHFRILNSSFFNQSLTLTQINKLYNHYRCLLVHNAALPIGRALSVGGGATVPFEFDANGAVNIVHLEPLLRLVTQAADAFLAQIEEIIPSSRQGRALERNEVS